MGGAAAFYATPSTAARIESSSVATYRWVVATDEEAEIARHLAITAAAVRPTP